jgi:hypothetical protein
MKLLEHFKTFLGDQVDLNQTRVDQLDSSVSAVQTAIKDSGWKAPIIEFSAHGSWAHGTIIKPLPEKEFDADLLAIVNPVDGWEAKDYVNTLYAALEQNATYREKLRRYSHCVTIEYAGVRRIDIAPVVRGRWTPDWDEVCNRTTNEFERSTPTEYTKWVVEKNAIAGGNDLRKVTRLLKYLRDIKRNFTCPSFLLTTLLGYRVYESDKYANAFPDTPTTLKCLLGRLDDWLQANPTLPEVRNPVFPTEVQSKAWDETKYSNFRDKINLYRGWVDEAYDEQDRDESIGKWRRVFGDDFAPGEAKEAAARISESAIITKSTGAVAIAGQYKDLVEWVKLAGLQVIPARLRKLPHIERPKWRKAQNTLTVKVSAQLLTGEYGTSLGPVTSGQPLPSKYWIRFTAANNIGAPFPDDYSVWWRVTNTDKVATAADQLRGEFYKSDASTPASRKEHLEYRGVHFVEAFLIRKSDDRLVGQSEPFYVVIE